MILTEQRKFEKISGLFFEFSGKLLKPITYSQDSIVSFSVDTPESSCS